MTALNITPSEEEFITQAGNRQVISVYTRLRSDDWTPLGIYTQLCGQRAGTCLFESAETGRWARWSFIVVNSAAILKDSAGQATWTWTDQPVDGLPSEGNFLDLLDATLALLYTERDPDLPPFNSGLVGYLGYDTAKYLENLPAKATDDLKLPDALMLLASDLVAVDHHLGEIWLIANAINFNGQPEYAAKAWRDARDRVIAMADQLARPHIHWLKRRDETSALIPVRRQRSSEEFISLVNQAKEYIGAGDVFQVVPSQRFEIDTVSDALGIYAELRLSNPSPYLYLLQLTDGGRDFALIGSSPEALVTVRNRQAATRPIAGTRPRGIDEINDQALEAELLADEKERAEHLMLVDLGRNDLGKVCVPGTVRVDEFMQVHRYSHVMHLESLVSGTMLDGTSALDATMACFPAGTLTGAPKIRAMEIIDTLETTRRGPYAGVVGYFDFAGDSDAAIAIRTAILVDGVAHIQAGAGIVADSIAENEDLECQNKAAALVQAILRANSIQTIQEPLADKEQP